MKIPKPIIPTCRYGHGPLFKFNSGKTVDSWGLIAQDGPIGLGFFVDLYICKDCGYVELFDNDPQASSTQQSPT